jgi:hypothetical protein
METAVPYACRPQEPLPDVEVGVRAQRPANRRGEYVALALPVGTGRDPFPFLRLLVLAENLDQRVG